MTPIGWFIFSGQKEGMSFGIMHRYRYERSRKVGKQYIELFLLIKLVIIKVQRKRKKKDKGKYLHESSHNINGIGPRCAILRAHLDVL